MAWVVAAFFCGRRYLLSGTAAGAIMRLLIIYFCVFSALVGWWLPALESLTGISLPG